ncbi:hypothetical protein DP144_06555 [Clostridium tetani]|uniref:phage replisome organizer N-terminal domain-containing protein n=1 Tax=Clostridium tetani TaxID=1513 RepID=UPI00100A8C22|nr:phage replisome organizer N-terminal domain-containing protein [Clostridium tetani]RXM77189.1 hypothetical protein DP154_06545 [Clostridium tetani]RYU99434.1 hypothetical protein DP144_06555 [Clostridium tetani]
MAEVKWIRITTSMFEDEKIDFIDSLPESDTILIIWIKLLTLAGKCNLNGFIFLTEKIPYTEEMLAHKFRRPLNTVKLALETLAKLGMLEFDNNGFVKIANWEKHQNIEGLDKIREKTRLRVARHREKQKLKELEDSKSNVTCNATVTQSNAIDIDKELDIDIEEDIERDKEEDTKEYSVPYKEIKELYNSTCKSLSQVRSISSTRKNHLKARWSQFNYNLDTFREVFEKVEASKFCTGTNDRGWKADFDWLIKNDNNMVKALEGKYDNKGGDDDPGRNNKANKEEIYDFSNY